jgi:hypothetical protein
VSEFFALLLAQIAVFVAESLIRLALRNIPHPFRL